MKLEHYRTVIVAAVAMVVNAALVLLAPRFGVDAVSIANVADTNALIVGAVAGKSTLQHLGGVVSRALQKPNMEKP